MFTGIVEETGTVRHVGPSKSGSRLEIACSRVLDRLSVGDSVDVAGSCLMVIERGGRVNLERAATPETALGGHLVHGQVDGTTKLVARRSEGEGARLRFALPKTTARYIVMKGFITIDGVSLTIAGLGKTYFEVALIPHTAERTTLGALGVGEAVNIEVDIVAKYVERLLRKS